MSGRILHLVTALGALLAGLSLRAPAAAAAAADLVFVGGPVYTVDPARPEARAVAVSGSRIVFVGDSAGVAPYVGRKTRVINLAGRALFPGFVDSHAGLLDYARAERDVDLSGARDFDEVIRRMARAARAARPHAWVIGWGWNQEEWAGAGGIRQDDLAAATGNHPVCLYHAADRAVMGNRVSLEIAGISSDDPDPPGGRLVRIPHRSPTGVLADAAAEFLTREIPPLDPDEAAGLYQAAAESCLARGVTQVHEMDVTPAMLAALEKAARSKRGLPLRVQAFLSGSPSDLSGVLAAGPLSKPVGGRLTARAVLVPADGGLCTRGAALSQEYLDEAGWAGYLRFSPENLAGRVRAILGAGFQPVIEASGDVGVGAALDALEAARDTLGDGADLAAVRPRIEKAVMVSPEDRQRFRALGVVASVLPARIGLDHRWMENRVGPTRLQTVLPCRSLLDSGVPLAFGGGSTGGLLDPVIAFHAAVTRQSTSGRPAGGWNPEEKLTREEALAALTRGPAYAGFDEAEAGAIRLGARADLTVLSRDIMRIPENEIPEARAVLTVVDGRVVYERAADR